MPNNSPKVSVIVSVYNLENCIDKSINSLLRQTFKNFELIIVNDGSTDATEKHLEKFTDKRIKIINKKNGGLSSARNVGLKYSSGDYIIQIDGDDYIEPNLLDACVHEFSDNKVDVVFFGIDSVDENDNKLKFGIEKSYQKKQYSSGMEIIELLAKDELKNFSVGFMARNSVLNKVDKPVFPEGIMYEDLASTYKIMMVAGKVNMISGIYYHYVQYSNSITHSPSFKQYEDLKVIENKLLMDLKDKCSEKSINSWKFHIEVMQYQILSYNRSQNQTLMNQTRKSILSLKPDDLRITEKVKVLLLKMDIYKFLYTRITKLRLM